MADNDAAEAALDRAALPFSYEEGGITVHLGSSAAGRLPPSAAAGLRGAGYEFIGATIRSYGVDLKFQPTGAWL